MSLSSLIVQREIATIRQVEEALARQVLYGGDLVTNLLEVAKLDEGTLTVLLAESFGLPAANVGPLPMPNERARSLVPPDMAAARAIMPLGTEPGAIVVAVAEPLVKEAEEELSFALGLRVVQKIAPMVRVREGLARAYGQPIERRLQRLLTRLGSAPAPAAAPAQTLQPAPEEAPRPPPRASATPTSVQAAPSMRPEPMAEGKNGGAPAAAAAPIAATGDTSESPRATLLQRDSAAPRGQRRRRGPITPDVARKELEETDSRDAVLDLFFDYARQYFDFSALFVVHAEIAEGREAFGDGASRERVQAIGVPLDLPSILATARDARSAVRVLPSDDGLDPVLLGDLERTTRGEVLVVPIVVRTRTVAILYGDSGDDGVDADATKEVVSFAQLVGGAFEKLIVRKKLHGHMSQAAPAMAKGDSERVPAKPPSERVPEPVISSLSSSVPAPVHMMPTAPAAPIFSPSFAPQKPSTLPTAPLPAPLPEQAFPSEFPSSPHHAISPAATSNAPPSTPHAMGSPILAVHASDRPPPSTAAAVRRPSLPPIPREEPDSDKPPPTPTIPDGSVMGSHAPPSESFAVAPHKPPSARATEGLSLPSVIVDVDEAFGALVDKVVAMGTDETAEAELLRAGPSAMPAIMSRFPGPTVVDRARVEDGSMRVADCGPVLRLIANQRRTALPFVLPIVGDGNPVRRYWATFLITELPYAEAVDPVVPRLFDPDIAVRRVARYAARAVAEVAPEALMERLVRYYRDPSLSIERRVEMIGTLGELRERLAVPLLIEALGDAEEPVAAAARVALMTIARQDLGRDAKKWQGWWAHNAGRHRIEWLIDALMHEVPAIRRAAGDELKALTKEYFGYYDDLPRKDREKSQTRYREWWNTEGRLRFQRR